MAAQNDVIVIGAGVAGLTAAAELSQHGLSVRIIEARDRVGGRVFTSRVAKSKITVELGAEFIHGLVPEILEPLQRSHVEIVEVNGDNWCIRNGKLRPCDFFGEVDKILRKMKDRGRDLSFSQFLEECCPNPKNDSKLKEIKSAALRYVTGFNAADAGKVSVNWLVQQMRAEDEVSGDRAFRALKGYDAMIQILKKRVVSTGVAVNLRHIAHNIRWSSGKIILEGTAPKRAFKVAATRLLITVPLGVLLASPRQKGGLKFDPRLPAFKTTALSKLAMGHVIRVTLIFRGRFWENIRCGSKSLSDLSFLFSEDAWFPTWWTAMPNKAPVITGWAPFKSADRLSGKTPELVADRAVRSLASLVGVSQTEVQKHLHAVRFHDWESDPFSRGAYSYVKVGGKSAPKELGEPIGETLFFAGEATDSTGNTGTVHGAIASGERAAHEILRSIRRS